MSLKRRIASNISWLGTAQAMRSITSLFVTALLARLLTPEEFGLIALVLVASGFFSMFAETGLTSALVQRASVTERHLSTAFWLNLGVATAIAIAGVAFTPLAGAILKEPRTTLVLPVVMLALPVGALGQVSDSILQRRLEFRSIAVVEWLSNAVSGAIAIALAVGGFGVWALVSQIIAASAVGSAGRLLAAGWRPRPVFSRHAMREMSSFSLSVFAGHLVNFAFRKIDNFVIGRVAGTAALGYYALAYNLILFPLAACSAVVLRVMFPVLSSLQNDREKLALTYLRSVRLLAIATLPLVLGLAAVAPEFIRVVYGDRWAQTATLVRILSVVGALEALNTSGILFYAIGRPGFLVRWALVSVVMMTAAFAYGVQWGSTGVAWTYVAISPVLYIMPHVFANRRVRVSIVRFLSAIGPALAASSIMAGAVLAMASVIDSVNLSDWAALGTLIGTGVIVYSASLWMLGLLLGRRQGGAFCWVVGDHMVADANGKLAPA